MLKATRELKKKGVWGTTESVFKKREQATCGVEKKFIFFNFFLNGEGNMETLRKKGECWGQLKVFEKREMTVNGEGNWWTKKVETIESVSEK